MMNFDVLIKYVLITAFSALYGDHYPNYCAPELECTTPSCQKASEYILKHLNQSINPCDDFYEFACGKYLSNHHLLDNELQYSKFVEIRDLVYSQLNETLQEPQNDNDPRVFNLAKQYYNTCMDTQRMDEYGLKSAKLLLKSFGGWPVVEGKAWNENLFDWKNITYKLRQHGLPADRLFTVRVAVDTINKTRKFIAIDETNLIVNRINVLHGFSNTVIYAYYKYLINMAVEFGANRSDAVDEMKETLEFLIELGKITSTSVERQDFLKYNNIITFKNLQKMFPFVNWLEYVNNVIAIPGIRVSDRDIVNVANLQFFTKLEELLEDTPKRVLANYMISMAVTNMGGALNKETRDIDNQLYRDLLNSNPYPIWMQCIAFLTESLRIGTSALYVRKYFNEDIKLKVQKLTNSLHDELKNKLKFVDWMDKETKDKALKKANKLKWYIAYPDELMDEVMLHEHYKELNSSDEHFQFALKIEKFNKDNDFRSLIQMPNASSWLQYTSAQKIEAYYIFSENAIILPAGILQAPIFDTKRPKFMNYGGIGYIIGHELTHGFDYMGKQINENGETKDWWSAETTQAFLNKKKCINDLYSSYIIPELNMHINGLVTQNENIADNGGILLAYNAYKTWVKRNGPERCLPNLKYNTNQLFWISTAISWCSKEKYQLVRSSLISSHPISSLRIFGITSNSADFAKDFNCPSGSKMNPKHKCSFW